MAVSAPVQSFNPIALRIAPVRAAIALVWAAALVLAVGDRVPTTASELPVAVALLLTAYPLIDAAASLVEARSRAGGSARVLLLNAGLGAAAAVGLALATFTGDAGAALVVFGAWASLSGAVQLGVALRRRRDGGRQWPLIVSGGLSTVVGLSFVAAAGKHDAQLAMLAGYAAFGAVLYLVWTVRALSGGGRR
ncbi:DUF308 domain-containing protein [Conexibacter sp. JD483]|uniref:DUF308 domain-containing protein n=1 Tax=unclassified Conexibacter TaxID=2627773 RepID=UPI00272357B2|nr:MULTISPECIES: DUF308 domain-containing protein [unclassified Conexibacter]MDO8188599.1 DUF308 domain-containing protein [Conexibacter sp. CPCC 205706]MDO8201489.1 DUF308 domain-containing protein [Conexibacter sp. CPCC 205762]MDR9370856.1 DUF308 domain-containing protein [Conexibacter sp. JD483]